MSLLDGLPAIFNAALGNLIFRDATLKVPGAESSDGQGGFTTAEPSSLACKALVLDFSDYRRATLGIPANDRMIMVLGASIQGGVVPQMGQIINAADPAGSYRDWQIIAVDSDPAAATYELQGR